MGMFGVTLSVALVFLHFIPFLLSDQMRTFHLIEKEMNQYEARAACRANYTDLATVNNDEDTTALTILTKNLPQTVWIGLQRDKRRPKWSNGDEFTLNSTWVCGTVPCCAVMRGSGSVEMPSCTDKRNFMCYKQYETGHTLSYHLITESLNWYEAQSYCRKIYTDLVSISDQNQREAVKIAGMISSTFFWIGLLLDDWEWGDGGRSAYRNWASGSPEVSTSSPSPDCVQFREGKWDTMRCILNVPAVCYKISSPPAQSRLRSFHLLKKDMSQTEAQQNCRRSYTDLVTVYNEEENAALAHLVGRSTAWIGLVRRQLSSKWSNGDEVIFTNLTSGCEIQPCCAAMKTNGVWQYFLCTVTRNFMCYKQDEIDLTFSYHLITDQPLTWYEAQSYCREIYTDLISIRDQNQNEAVMIAGINSSSSFWIGLLEDDWEWADGGRSAYRNWGAGQPESLPSSSSSCAQLNDGTWKSVSCVSTSPALCYNTYIHVSDDYMSWENALDYCKKENRNGLLRIESDLEQKQLESELRRRGVSGPMWVGLGQKRISELLKLSSRLSLGPWTEWTGVRPQSASCGESTTIEKSFRVKTDVSKLRAVCELKQLNEPIV